MTTIEYCTEIINSMTLDELRELNKSHRDHLIWSLSVNNELWDLFKKRFQDFGHDIKEFEGERSTYLKKIGLVKDDK